MKLVCMRMGGLSLVACFLNGYYECLLLFRCLIQSQESLNVFATKLTIFLISQLVGGLFDNFNWEFLS